MSRPVAPGPDAVATGRVQRRDAVAHVVLDYVGGDVIEVEDDVAHHLLRVLRVRDGELVSLTDLAGSWRLATAAQDRKRIDLVPTSAVMFEPAAERPVTIASAIPKGDRLDWMVQKTTELGADVLVLLHTDRSATTWEPDRSSTNLDRLRRISREACRQSRRVWGLAIDGPVAATEILPSAAVAEPGGRTLTHDDGLIAVGPEGGWSPRELAAAGDLVSLGSNVLRTETAAIAATALSVTLRH